MLLTDLLPIRLMFTRFTSTALVLTLCLLASAFVHPSVAMDTDPRDEAADPVKPAPQDDDDPLRFSGQIFANYQWNATSTGPTENFNSFGFNRWYTTVKADLSEKLNFRGTTDVKLNDTGYSFIIKYAYLDWQMSPAFTLRAGIQQTGWQNYVNKVWGYRGIAKSMAQYQGHLSMADLGASLTADLPKQSGELSVGVLNGQGYRAAEANQFKDVVGRVRLTPFKSGGGALAPLEVGGHAYYGSNTDGSDRHRWGGLVAYNGDAVTLALNYDARKDGETTAAGVSSFGSLGLGTVSGVGAFSLVGLVDFYSVETPNADGEEIRTVVGLAYAPTDAVTVSFDYQQDQAEDAVFRQYDGGFTDTDGSLFVHLIVNY